MTQTKTTERLDDPTMTVLPEGGLPAVREAKPVLDDRQTEASRPPAAIPEQTVKNIAIALTSVMGKIGIIEKHGINRFHNYKYAAMQDILQKLTPLMAKQGIAVIPTEVGRSMFDNDRAIGVEYEFTIIHTSGDIWPERPRHTGVSRCRDSRGNFDDKAFNKCFTAARKYFFLALFNIATGDEDDADEDANRLPPTRPIPKHDPDGVIIDDALPEWDDAKRDPAFLPPNPPIRPPPRPKSAEAADHTPRVPPAETGAGGAAETDSERLMRLDQELTTAAEDGTEELRRAWLLIPPRDRPALEAALRNRHKPRASAVDAAKAP